MSEAPERIWIEDEFGDGDEDQWTYGTWDVRNYRGYDVEYIRADTVQAQIDAAVAAERERCARVANAHLVSSSFGPDHPVRVVYSEFIAAAILKGEQP
jgi:hypothetical protein